MNNIGRSFSERTMDAILRKKTGVWITSLLKRAAVPKEQREEKRRWIENGVIITGGAIASMLQGDLPNDFDVYFSNTEVATWVARAYLPKVDPATNHRIGEKIDVEVLNGNQVRIFIKSMGVIDGDPEIAQRQVDNYRYFESDSRDEAEERSRNEVMIKAFPSKKPGTFDPILITVNAISLSDGVQLVLRFVGPAEEIHRSYDFLHCTNWWTPNEGLHLRTDAVMAAVSKTIRYVGSLYPLASMFRLRKFIKRGYSVSAGEMLKIAFDISRLNLRDARVLKEQLIGIDVAYFRQVLDLISVKDNESLDRTYLFDVINRVFDGDLSEAIEDSEVIAGAGIEEEEETEY